ncbi:MAG: hypothetical protein JWN89_113 [Parcubacteria group bacterium]|nr:hypothetical protein [Parcubacteria group bacterium]
MSIQEAPEIIKYTEDGHIERFSWAKRAFVPLLIILIAVLGFGVGRLTAPARSSGLKVEFDPSVELSTVQGPALDNAAAVGASVLKAATSLAPSVLKAGGQVFASSKGKKYYYPGCKNTISEKNKVFFATPAMAESAGYTIAANCKP